MDLYQPLYSQRPVVQPELYTSLRPQVYGDTREERVGKSARRAREDAAGRRYRRRSLVRFDAMAARTRPAPNA